MFMPVSRAVLTPEGLGCRGVAGARPCDLLGKRQTAPLFAVRVATSRQAVEAVAASVEFGA